jgi:hypothetical protein
MVRKHVEENFSARVMANKYQAVYERVIHDFYSPPAKSGHPFLNSLIPKALSKTNLATTQEDVLADTEDLTDEGLPKMN